MGVKQQACAPWSLILPAIFCFLSSIMKIRMEPIEKSIPDDIDSLCSNDPGSLEYK